MSDHALVATGTFASLTCSDLAKSIALYVDGLGFEIVHRTEEDGVLQFVMVKSGAALLGLGRDDFAKGRDRTKGVGMRLWFTTAQDVVPVAARLKAAGHAIDTEPAPLPWGPMAFAFTDPDGFPVTICADM